MSYDEENNIKGPSYRVIIDIHVLLLNTGKTIYRKVIDE